MNTVFVILAFLIGVILRVDSAFFSWLKKALNTFLIYLGLPLLIVVSFENAKDIPLLSVFFASFVMVVFLMVGSYFFSRWYGASGKEKASLFICNAFGNTAYLGIPVLYALWGSQGSVVATIMSIVTIFLHNTIGLVIAFSFARGHKNNWGFLKTPFFWTIIAATVIGLLVKAVPGWISDVGTSSIYIAVFLIGATIKLGKMRWRMVVAVLPKLLLPLLLLPMLFFFDSEFILPLLVVSMMPAAFTNISQAIEFSFDRDVVAQMIFVGTVIYLVGLAMIVFIF